MTDYANSFFYFSAFSAPATGSRKYTAITCYQVQAWPWSFTLLVSVICWPGICQLWLSVQCCALHGGEDGSCRNISSQLCIALGDQGVPECRAQQWVVEGKRNSRYQKGFVTIWQWLTSCWAARSTSSRNVRSSSLRVSWIIFSNFGMVSVSVSDSNWNPFFICKYKWQHLCNDGDEFLQFLSWPRDKKQALKCKYVYGNFFHFT